LSATVTPTNPNCSNTNDGAITVSSATGGYGTYEFSVNGGTSWQVSGSFPGLSGLAAPGKDYNVLVRDQAHASCVIDLDGAGATTLISPPALDASTSTYTNETCLGSDGKIDLTVTGGTAPYGYSWSTSAISEDISSLAEGTYTVIITDANQCTLVKDFTIDLACVLRVYQAVSPNGDGKNDYWRIDKIEQYPGNTVRLFDRFNNLVYETHGYSNETNNWTGQSNHGLTRGNLPDDTYFYWVDLGSGLGKLSGFVILKNH
jgi:gliding motility-associated-like protein